jgi:hypothetical protein
MLTVFTLRIHRRHNQLSVKPLGDFYLSNFESKLAVTIENRGNGPLIIKSFQAVRDGISKPNLLDWMPQLPPGILWSNYAKDLEGTALRPSESVPLIEFSLDTQNREHTAQRDRIRQSLAKITVELHYTDIYDNEFSTPQQSLSRFVENLTNDEQS